MTVLRVSAEVFACHSAACRPPTSGGTGGSSGGGAASKGGSKKKPAVSYKEWYERTHPAPPPGRVQPGGSKNGGGIAGRRYKMDLSIIKKMSDSEHKTVSALPQHQQANYLTLRHSYNMTHREALSRAKKTAA